MIIDKLIKNELTLKRWRQFRRTRRAVIALWIFLALIALSLCAELVANSKPVVLKYQGNFYFPVYIYYHPTVFNQAESMVTDYRKLELKGSDWAIWPVIPWDPFESNVKVESYPAPPSKDNLLGTDDRGRDVLVRLIYGFRYSISFAILVWMTTYLIGVLVGGFTGFVGGKVDLLGQRVVEVFDAMPALLLLITLISIFGANLSMLVIFSALFGWMFISVYTRAEFLRLRKRDFVESARALGAGRWRLILKHILPNALGPVVTFSPFAIAAGILELAILDYLGLGLPPPTPSWGELLQQAQKSFTYAWWLAVYPSIALFLSLTVLNLIGEGVRNAFDPRKAGIQ